MAKKMTKQAVAALADKAAQTQRDVFTLDQLDGMDYNAKRTEAQRLAQIGVDTAVATGAMVPGVGTGEVEGFVAAFVDRLTSLWNGRVTERETARRNWRRALDGMTAKQATAELKALADGMHLRAKRIDTDGWGLHIEFERAWTVSADVYLRWDHDYEGVANPDDASQKAGRYSVRCEIGWSSTSRSVSDALAAVTLYRQAVEAAAELEAVASRMKVIWTYGIEREAPAMLDVMKEA